MKTTKSKHVFLKHEPDYRFSKGGQAQSRDKDGLCPLQATCSASCPPVAQNTWDCTYQCAKYKGAQPLCSNTDHTLLPKHTPPEVTIPPEKQMPNSSHWEEPQGCPWCHRRRVGQQGETKGGKVHTKQQEKPPGTVQHSERDTSSIMETLKNIRKLLIFIYLH